MLILEVLIRRAILKEKLPIVERLIESIEMGFISRHSSLNELTKTIHRTFSSPLIDFFSLSSLWPDMIVTFWQRLATLSLILPWLLKCRIILLYKHLQGMEGALY